MINLGSEGKTCAIVRVPSTHSDLITHALDAGNAPLVLTTLESQLLPGMNVMRLRCAKGVGLF